MQLTQGKFADQLREALARLYDPVALSAHPLARVAGPGSGGLRSPRGAAALRETLIAGIEALKPGPHLEPNARAWRPYRILNERYVEGHDAAEVQRRLAIGKSQYYREHEAALACLAGLLWEQRVEPILPTAAPRRARWRTASRWRVVSAAGICAIVPAAVFLLRARVSPDPAAARAGEGGSATLGGWQTSGLVNSPVVAATLSVYAGSGQSGHVNGAAAGARFAGPFGLTLDNGGTLYVADTGNHRIRSITTTGLVLDVAGSGVEGYADGASASAQFSSPNAVTVGTDGTVYVADAGNLRIRAVSPSGMVSTLAGSGVAGYADGVGTAAQFAVTGAIVADREGMLYVPDRSNNVIRTITPSGTVSTFAGSGTRGHVDGAQDVAQFNVPMRMGGVDGAGNVYVLDTGDNRFRKITPERTVSTVAGGGVPGFADGPVEQAQFSSDILGLTVDTAGRLYVMDAGNRRIRQITPTGVVSTLFEFTNPEHTPGNIKVDLAGNLYLSDRQHNVIYKVTIPPSR